MSQPTTPPTAADIEAAVERINKHGRTFFWFHYARWVEEAKRIGIFCSAKRDKGEYNPTLPPRDCDDEIRAAFREAAGGVPYGLLFMTRTQERPMAASYDEVKAKLGSFFGDTKRPRSETKSKLQELRDEIDIMIESLGDTDDDEE